MSTNKFETMNDADLNRAFARAFWHENQEGKPLPDFVNNWSEVRKVLVNAKTIIPLDWIYANPHLSRCRRAMIHLLNHPETTTCQHGMPHGYLCKSCTQNPEETV